MADLYTFLPWVRQGAVSAITTEDPLNDTLDSRVRMDVKVFLNNNTDQNNPDAKITARLYGPGDVTGFDQRQVIRTDPLHLTSDFEPNYFPVVEFDRPDFPWLFTPAKASSNQQLRPWICLIAVKKQEGVTLTTDPNRPLPVLRIDKPANAQNELPDLSESWAWAHAQISGEAKDETALKSALNNSPERTLSRLLCPRHLEPNKSYYACVVPAFDIGRKAGLGEKVNENEDDAKLKPAWDITKSDPIELPVYYHWEFSTGAAGDFESLVWLLQRRQLSPTEVGTRKVKVTKPAPNWPVEFEVPLEGALRPPGPQNPIAIPQSFQDELQKLLNAGENQKSLPALPPGLPIPPPIYGRWHAAQKSIPDGKRDAAWLRELNLDPSHRAVASIGTQIVQDQQEQLMASAWEQVGEIEKANQALRQAQLARAAGKMIHEQYLEAMPAETLLYVTGATHARVLNGTQTLYAEVGNSVVPQAAVQGPFRRLTRPRGPLSRRLKGGLRTGKLIKRLNEGEIGVVPPKAAPNGMVTMDAVFETLHKTNPDLYALEKFCTVTPRRIKEKLMRLMDFLTDDAMAEALQPKLNSILASDMDERARDLVLGCRDLLLSMTDLLRSGADDAFLQAISLLTKARDLIVEAMRAAGSGPLWPKLDTVRSDLFRIIEPIRNYIGFAFAVGEHQKDIEPCDPITPPRKPKLSLENIKKTLLEKLDPEVTIPKRIMARLTLPPAWEKRLEDPIDPVDELEPILVAPEFPKPMYKPLADLSQDLILPGLEHVPPNTITLLETNARFVEAYMVGLNHEMSRELLWREFPTDQRGTYFRQFWDQSGRVPQPKNPEDLKDIKAISDWRPEKGLGKNLTGDATKSQTVLLIRGDLLRRYPRAIIYAAEAKWVQAKDKDDTPIFDNQGKPVMIREPKELPANPDPSKSGFPEKYPIFQGTLSPDITFLGFDLDPKKAKGDQEPNPNADNAGWFFVLQQPPTEPRYGLDETEPPPKDRTGTWRDLSWENLILTNNNHIKLSNAFIGNFTAPTTPSNVKWDSNSAAMAYITLQGPFRVAIHASDLLPVEESKQ